MAKQFKRKFYKAKSENLNYKFRRNEYIRAAEIRVVDEEGELVGVMTPSAALQIAREQEKDLIEIAPMANPPVCKIIDWSKFKYEYSKKQRVTKQHTVEMKEMWFKPRTDIGDLNHKVARIKEFLDEKHKVKITVRPSYSDRRMSKTFYFDLIAKVLEELGESADVETPAKEEGRNVFAIIKPRK